MKNFMGTGRDYRQHGSHSGTVDPTIGPEILRYHHEEIRLLQGLLPDSYLIPIHRTK